MHNNLELIDAPDPKLELERLVLENWLPENVHTRRAYMQAVNMLRNSAGCRNFCYGLDTPEKAAAAMTNFMRDLHEKYAPRTVNVRVNGVRKLLQKLEKAAVIAPCSFWLETRKVRQSALLPSDLPDPHKVIALFRVEGDSRWRALWRVMYYCGLRVSEALSLTPASIERLEGNTCLRFIRKGGHEAVVEVVDWLADDLRELADTLKTRERMFPWHYSTVEARCRRKFLAAGWEGSEKVPPTPHCLRHCHISHALEKVGLVDSGRSAGHMSLDTTNRTYAHDLPRSNGHVLPRE